jgi:3-methyladenine DNA glycosylase/8-oxoguanine DNA glycosylase
MIPRVETLPLRPPFDWEGLLHFFSPRAIPGVEAVEEGVLRRSFRKGSQVGVLEVRLGKKELHLQVWSDGDTGWLKPLAAKVFDTERNPNEIEKQLGGDATLGPLLAKWPGVRLPGAWDGFEMGIRAILGQQVSVKAAHTLAGRLVAKYGHHYPSPFPSVTKLFPLAEEVAAIPVGELASIGITQKRAETLGHFARWSALAEAERGPLLDLPGIGPWTESYLRMRGRSDADAFPAGDLGIQKALGIVGLGPVKAAREAELRSAPWRPYRAYAVFLLWRSLSLEGAVK